MPFELDELDPLEVPFELEPELLEESFELELELLEESFEPLDVPFELEPEPLEVPFELDEPELLEESFELEPELLEEDVDFDEVPELDPLFELTQPMLLNANTAKQKTRTAAMILSLPLLWLLLGLCLTDAIGYPLRIAS